MDKQTYILFRRTGENVPHVGPRYQAIAKEYRTPPDACMLMLHYAEDDHGIMRDEDDEIKGVIHRGEMSYEHDSRTYELVLEDEMDDEQQAIYERDLNY